MDINSIAKSAGIMAPSDIGKPTHKGAFKEITVELDKGFIIIVLKASEILIGLLGTDGRELSWIINPATKTIDINNFFKLIFLIPFQQIFSKLNRAMD